MIDPEEQASQRVQALHAASLDAQTFGSGWVRILADGTTQHIPKEQIRFAEPPDTSQSDAK